MISIGDQIRMDGLLHALQGQDISNLDDDYTYFMKRNFPENAKPYKFLGHNIQFVPYDEHLSMHRGDKEVNNAK